MVKVQSSATMVECQVDANQELKNKQTKIYTFLCGFNIFLSGFTLCTSFLNVGVECYFFRNFTPNCVSSHNYGTPAGMCSLDCSLDLIEKRL